MKVITKVEMPATMTADEMRKELMHVQAIVNSVAKVQIHFIIDKEVIEEVLKREKI